MSPSTRALLAAAREGLGPDPAAIARVRAKLDVALAGTAAAAPAAATGSLALKLALKLAAVAVVAGAVAIVAVPRHASTPISAPPLLLLDDTAHVDVPAPTVQTAAREPTVQAAAREPTVGAAAREPAAPAPVNDQPAIVHVSASPAPAPAPVVEATLAREVELIDDAMASLHAGDATAALAAIAAFQRETAGHGQLLEEASAIEIEASCKLHLDVTDKLAAFDRAWPSSPERARLTAACP
jgi:hypothetical protein